MRLRWTTGRAAGLLGEGKLSLFPGIISKTALPVPRPGAKLGGCVTGMVPPANFLHPSGVAKRRRLEQRRERVSRPFLKMIEQPEVGI